MIRQIIVVFASVSAFAAGQTAHAEQLGSYGNSWGIAEQDGVDSIKSRLRKLDKDGQMDRLWKDFRTKQLDGVNNPPPVAGISKVTKAATWTFDPTYTYPEDVKDHLGNLLVPAGTKINPLDYIRLSKDYIFIDGRDDAQVAFAKKRIDAHPMDRVVLVGGSYVKLDRLWKRPVYFDQRGILVNHFGIKRVPAVLSQRGKVLVVEEIPL